MTIETKIRLMLVDDHEVIRQGLISLFESYPEIEVVAEAGNGQEAVERALEIQPDVILMDVTMPVMDGFEATRILEERCKACNVLALTVHEDREFMLKMIDSGARGFVTKRSLAEDVVTAIKIVAEGGYFLSPHYIRLLVDEYRSSQTREPDYDRASGGSQTEDQGLEMLSDREREVVSLVADGYTSEEVGNVLGITAKTVSRHRARIMEKLQINTTVDLVKFAIRNRLSSL